MAPSAVTTSARHGLQIGPVILPSPFALAPMAGMTDTAFRRLVKRKGGCGLVVTEMVSSEGLVRGIDRTLEYAEYTEEERPISIQIFGGDADRMAAAAQIVEGMGADIVDVNMGCPVPKIANHHAGCRLMREPERAAAIVGAIVQAVRIPVTVKMRAGWNAEEVNAPELAGRLEAAGAAAFVVHGRTAAQAYAGEADWCLIGDVARRVRVPVFGSGDCIEPTQMIDRLRDTGVAGVIVGRGALRNPWVFQQALCLLQDRVVPDVSLEDRGRFLLEYIDLLLAAEGGADEAAGFRHVAPGAEPAAPGARGRERWVINKIRALAAWYTKGLESGSKLRTAINAAESLPHVRDLIRAFFFDPASAETGRVTPAA